MLYFTHVCVWGASPLTARSRMQTFSAHSHFPRTQERNTEVTFRSLGPTSERRMALATHHVGICCRISMCIVQAVEVNCMHANVITFVAYLITVATRVQINLHSSNTSRSCLAMLHKITICFSFLVGFSF